MRSLTATRYGSSPSFQTSLAADVVPPHVEWYGALMMRPLYVSTMRVVPNTARSASGTSASAPPYT